MWETFSTWLKTHESLAIWLEGIALVLIFVWDRIDSRQQHRETLAQLKVSQDTLKVLERSNLREREAQHLSDIKTQVVSPMLQWLDFGVVKRLRGRDDLVGIMAAPGYEPSPRAPRQLYPPYLQMVEGFSPDLYDHAMGEHFETLRKYQAFREKVEQFFGTLTEFGNRCCADIQKLTSLPSFDGDTGKNFVNCECAIQFYLRAIVGGEELKFYDNRDTKSRVVMSPYSNQMVARGPDEEIQKWVDRSKELFEKSWADSRLLERIQRTLDDADKLRDAIRQIELTYALKPCKYVRD
jgi:hypothetical protein